MLIIRRVADFHLMLAIRFKEILIPRFRDRDRSHPKLRGQCRLIDFTQPPYTGPTKLTGQTVPLFIGLLL